MKPSSQIQPIRDTIVSLLEVIDASPFRINECICVGRREHAEIHLQEFGGDCVGFEAFVNHVHMSDILPNILRQLGTDRSLMEQVARTIVRVWADRIRILLDGRSALFFLGGQDDVVIRFHIERPGLAPWVDPSDRAFVAKEHLQVFRVTADRFEQVA
jgi:hypothetical protein